MSDDTHSAYDEAYTDRLAEFAALKEGWDSYGAAPVAPEVLESFALFLDAIQQGRAQIVPTPAGGCQVEVHEAGWDIEVEFDPEADDDSNGGVWFSRVLASKEEQRWLRND